MNEETLGLELRGAGCRCGSAKKPGETFCQSCYYRLPPAMRRALYRRVGSGYEESYRAAAEFLDLENARFARDLGTSKTPSLPAADSSTVSPVDKRAKRGAS